jgi:hypothetical protein
MKLELTTEEAQVLLNMINVAVMAKGLEAAESGAYFARKLRDAAGIVEAAANDTANVIEMTAKEA